MLAKYKTVVFDCDGVILDSNKIKTEAFYNAALPYGKQAAGMLREYHRTNGGISRYVKLRYFLDNIAPKNSIGPGINLLLERYAEHVQKGLETCTIAEGIEKLRQQTSGSNWLVASGSDQDELRQVFYLRGLTNYFDGGIFGSPDTKIKILQRECYLENILSPAIFLGDSTYDYKAAKAAGLDFLFVSNWTEVADWKKFVRRNALNHVASLSDMIVR